MDFHFFIPSGPNPLRARCLGPIGRHRRLAPGGSRARVFSRARKCARFFVKDPCHQTGDPRMVAASHRLPAELLLSLRCLRGNSPAGQTFVSPLIFSYDERPRDASPPGSKLLPENRKASSRTRLNTVSRGDSETTTCGTTGLPHREKQAPHPCCFRFHRLSRATQGRTAGHAPTGPIRRPALPFPSGSPVRRGQKGPPPSVGWPFSLAYGSRRDRSSARAVPMIAWGSAHLCKQGFSRKHPKRWRHSTRGDCTTRRHPPFF